MGKIDIEKLSLDEIILRYDELAEDEEVAEEIQERLQEELFDEWGHDGYILIWFDELMEIMGFNALELARELSDPDEELEQLSQYGVDIEELIDSFEFDDPRRTALRRAIGDDDEDEDYWIDDDDDEDEDEDYWNDDEEDEEDEDFDSEGYLEGSRYYTLHEDFEPYDPDAGRYNDGWD